MTILTFYVYALFVVFWLLFLSFLKLQHLFLLQRDADVDRKIQDFVVTKGGIICQFPQKKIDAVIILLGCFYVFNVSYTQCKAILTFLDQARRRSNSIPWCTSIHVILSLRTWHIMISNLLHARSEHRSQCSMWMVSKHVSVQQLLLLRLSSWLIFTVL